jgi:hypothetical protein
VLGVISFRFFVHFITLILLYLKSAHASTTSHKVKIQITQKLKPIVALGFEPKTSRLKQGGATTTAIA